MAVMLTRKAASEKREGGLPFTFELAACRRIAPISQGSAFSCAETGNFTAADSHAIEHKIKMGEDFMFRFCIMCCVWLLGLPGAAMAESAAERGHYLVNTIMACGNCHSPRDGNGQMIKDRAFSGGLTFNTPGFVATAPNITPDRETGIGSWSDAEIKRALVEGMRPDHGRLAGVALAAIMPANFYKALLPRISTPSSPTCTPSSRSETKSLIPSTRPRCAAIPIPTPRPASARPCSRIR